MQDSFLISVFSVHHQDAGIKNPDFIFKNRLIGAINSEKGLLFLQLI